MQETHDDTLGMRWATFCIYYLYPTCVLGFAVISVALWRAGMPAPSLAIGGVALYYVLGTLELHNGTAAGWKMNWYMIGGIALSHIASAIMSVTNAPPADAVGPVLAACTMPVWFLWPSIRYWRRRAGMFPESPDKPLRLQSVWMPVSAWLLVVAVIGAAIILPAVRDRQVRNAAATTNVFDQFDEAAPAQTIIDPFKATIPTQEQNAAAAAAAWRNDVAAFLQTRCELLVTTEGSRAQVAENTRIFQAALTELEDPSLSNMDLLHAAGERVYAYAGYTPRGACPDDGPATQPSPREQASTTTIALDLSHEASAPPQPQARKPRCEYKSIMTDEEMARCR